MVWRGGACDAGMGVWEGKGGSWGTVGRSHIWAALETDAGRALSPSPEPEFSYSEAQEGAGWLTTQLSLPPFRYPAHSMTSVIFSGCALAHSSLGRSSRSTHWSFSGNLTMGHGDTRLSPTPPGSSALLPEAQVSRPQPLLPTPRSLGSGLAYMDMGSSCPSQRHSRCSPAGVPGWADPGRPRCPSSARAPPGGAA